MTPGLRAAALLAADGRVLAGDPVLAALHARNGGDALALRGGGLTLLARVDAPVLRGLLDADMATALAAAEGPGGA
jgi:hypothetical protein